MKTMYQSEMNESYTYSLLQKTIEEKNQVLGSLGKKLAFSLLDSFIPGVVPVSRYYRDGEFSRMVNHTLNPIP